MATRRISTKFTLGRGVLFLLINFIFKLLGYVVSIYEVFESCALAHEQSPPWLCGFIVLDWETSVRQYLLETSKSRQIKRASDT